MNARRPRLILIAGTVAAESPDDALGQAFDVIRAKDLPDALGQLQGDDHGADVVVLSRNQTELDEIITGRRNAAVLRNLGEGVAVVDADGNVTWSNDRFDQCGESTRRLFIERCLGAMETHRQPGWASTGRVPGRNLHFSFASGGAHYEMMVSPAAGASDGDGVIGVLWEVTSLRELQAKVDAIDAAGSELMRIEAASISQLNMAGRLQLLEEKIVHYVRDLLHFDNFEIRLLDRDSNQLELVISEGISPLKIGEVIYAEDENNGISGYVASTGRSYICDDVVADPRYQEGLVDAGSSLTVPLRLHDRVIGVFNIESRARKVFDEHDRQFAEIFGRYIAMAMNILDLLVVERYTTNEQIAANVLDEIGQPLSEIIGKVIELREQADSAEAVNVGLENILASAESVRTRIEACAAGPRTILGAEKELRRHEPDPLMIGKRVLVADDEPAIRETISSILSQKGCHVTVCSNGGETIDTIVATPRTGEMYDLVISDIKMPDRNGYEVFRTVSEISNETPVILMTGFGYDPHHSIVRASQEGLSSFLFKPFKATQLLEAVTKAFS